MVPFLWAPLHLTSSMLPKWHLFTLFLINSKVCLIWVDLDPFCLPAHLHTLFLPGRIAFGDKCVSWVEPNIEGESRDSPKNWNPLLNFGEGGTFITKKISGKSSQFTARSLKFNNFLPFCSASKLFPGLKGPTSLPNMGVVCWEEASYHSESDVRSCYITRVVHSLKFMMSVTRDVTMPMVYHHKCKTVVLHCHLFCSTELHPPLSWQSPLSSTETWFFPIPV